jgi:hypothetical protein
LLAGLALPSAASSTHDAFSTTLNAFVDQQGFIGIDYADGTFRGTLSGAVDPSGKLELNGKMVSSVKYGRYALSVDDRASNAGFVLQQAHQVPVAVTGAAFTGKKTLTVDLTIGQWSYHAASGKKGTGYFSVHR